MNIKEKLNMSCMLAEGILSLNCHAMIHALRVYEAIRANPEDESLSKSKEMNILFS
jgi:hypothetical protein